MARGSADPHRWRRNESLLHRNAEAALTGDERRELDELRAEMDRLVYRKSFAIALLKWRGHEITSLIAGAGNASA